MFFRKKKKKRIINLNDHQLKIQIVDVKGRKMENFTIINRCRKFSRVINELNDVKAFIKNNLILENIVNTADRKFCFEYDITKGERHYTLYFLLRALLKQFLHINFFYLECFDGNIYEVTTVISRTLSLEFVKNKAF